MKQQFRGIDPLMYVRALGLLVRNLSIVVVPLLVGVIGVFFTQIGGAGGGFVGGLTGQIAGFILLLLNGFAFGTALILSDQAWRRGSASFDDGWNDARRKGGDMLFATMGFAFVIYVASYAGSIVGSFGLILMLVAVFFLIYTIAAAAIGGIPGGAAISASIERARANPLPTLVVAIVAALAYIFVSKAIVTLLLPVILPLVGDYAELVARLIGVAAQSLALGYVALILAKTYTDLSFRPRW